MKYLLGYYRDAITDFDKALSLEPNHTFARANKDAAKYAKQQQLSQALMNFGNALQQLGNSITNQSGSNNQINQIQNSTSSNVSSDLKCSYCERKGNGKCAFCNEQGQSKACVRNPCGVECKDEYCIAKNHKCKHCDGTHICSKCKGTGKYTNNPSFYF